MISEIEVCDCCKKEVKDTDETFILKLESNMSDYSGYPKTSETLATMCEKCKKEYLKEVKKGFKYPKIKWVIT